MKKDRNTQEEINSGRQEGNVALDGTQDVNAMANPAPVQESNVDGYSVPILYEDVGQFGSNTGKSVDGCNFMKKDRNTQEEINSGRQEGNVAPDGPQYVNGNPAPVQESNVDGYSVPTEYEDVGQLGSNTGEYNQLDPGTIGVPQQHYSALSTRPNDNNNNAASAGVYEEIR